MQTHEHDSPHHASTASSLRHWPHHADALRMHSTIGDCSSHFRQHVMRRLFHFEDRLSTQVSRDVCRRKFHWVGLRHLYGGERSRLRDEGNGNHFRYDRLDGGLVNISLGQLSGRFILQRGAGEARLSADGLRSLLRWTDVE